MVGRYIPTRTRTYTRICILSQVWRCARIYYGAMALNGGRRRGDDGRRRGDICVRVCVCTKGEKEYCRVRHKYIYLKGRNGLWEEWRSRDANAKRHYYNIHPLPDERMYIHSRIVVVVEYTTWVNVWRRRHCGRERRAVMQTHTHTHTHISIYIIMYIQMICKNNARARIVFVPRTRGTRKYIGAYRWGGGKGWKS